MDSCTDTAFRISMDILGNVYGTGRVRIPQRRNARRATKNGLSNVVRCTDESVPGPLWDSQTIRHVLSRVVVTRHRGRGGPREVIVKHASQPLVAGEADIFQRLIETGDRSLIHLFMRPVAAVNAHD